MSTCPDCATHTEVNSDDLSAGSGPGVTYDEGEGIKDKVTISGPLAETLAQQLNVIFKKQPMDLQDQPTSLQDLTAAQETLAQDTAVHEAFQAALREPDNEVILHGFDVKTIKEHVARMHEQDPKASDIQPHNQEINVVAGDINQFLDGKEMSAFDMKHDDELVLVTAPVVNNVAGAEDNILIHRSGNRIKDVYAGKFREVIPEGDYPTVTEKVQALERVYPGMKIHASMEHFVLSLINRKKK